MKIAVIGGVGSGKSTVLAMLKELGETVIDCDAVYRDVKKLTQFKKDMVAKYGDVLTDGEIDNKKVSAKVLCSKDAIDGLNALSHPYIKKELDKLTEGKSRVFVEVQVFEGGLLENYFEDNGAPTRRRNAQEARLRADSQRRIVKRAAGKGGEKTKRTQLRQRRGGACVFLFSYRLTVMLV